jgi:hypothetical protein
MVRIRRCFGRFPVAWFMAFVIVGAMVIRGLAVVVTLLGIVLSRGVVALAAKVSAIPGADCYRNHVGSIFGEVVLVKSLDLLSKGLE